MRTTQSGNGRFPFGSLVAPWTRDCHRLPAPGYIFSGQIYRTTELHKQLEPLTIEAFSPLIIFKVSDWLFTYEKTVTTLPINKTRRASSLLIPSRKPTINPIQIT